ncbi:hypothetical protein [Nocardia sp. NBC_01388]
MVITSTVMLPILAVTDSPGWRDSDAAISPTRIPLIRSGSMTNTTRT